MPTPAEEAFAEGFGALASVHGNTWTFGVASFAGVASALRPDDPRLAGGTDRLIEVIARTIELPDPAPVRGDEIACAGIRYRVARQPDHEPSTGLTTILVGRA